jgi:maltose alpha-D-glucosyltransferase/alpha-amylase
VRAPGAQGSNTTVALGHQLFLKGYRRLRAGLNPEVEIGCFLTEVARFPNSVPVAGHVEYASADGTVMTLALLQGYVENQGDGWSYTLDYLERFLDQCRTATAPGPAAEAHGGYLALMQTLGRRTAELHRAFAAASGDPAFNPEPLARRDLAAWVKQVREEAAATLDLLGHRRARLSEAEGAAADTVLARRREILERIGTHAPGHVEALKTRYHGDYHLGQVLLAQNDFVVIDFEGEPARPLAERRAKHLPLKDVAGMLRSFNYAAYTALGRLTAERPEDFARLEPHARGWEAEAARVFLGAYEETTRGSGLYGAWEEARGLLELFTLEKAFYELRYELANRPDWAHIPLRGILMLSGQWPSRARRETR